MPQEKIPNNAELSTLIQAVKIIYRDDGEHNRAIKVLKKWIDSDKIENSEYQNENDDIDELKNNWVKATKEGNTPILDPHKIARVLLLYICKIYLNIEDDYIQSLILNPDIIVKK